MRAVSPARSTPPPRSRTATSATATSAANGRPQVGQHIEALTADLGIDRDQVPELALRYVLGHPAVSTIAVGMRTIRNVQRNAALGDGPALPASQREALARHRWERNFYSA